MKAKSKKVVYVVIDVMRGVVSGARAFSRRKTAASCMERLRRSRNPNDDDVQLLTCVVSN